MEAENRTTPATTSSELITTPSTGPRGPVPALSPPEGGRSPTRPSTSTVSPGKLGGRSLRPFRAGDAEEIGSAIQTLRDARQKLRSAGAKRAAAAVARALKSAEGALRHADRIQFVAGSAS
jgi:hypothetical protein